MVRQPPRSTRPATLVPSTSLFRSCGTYGRQEPLPDTSAIDRRDLWTTFRDERVRQRVDYFFHNANSAIRKGIWRDQPFDEKIRGVEDREWGKRMIAAGYDIVYEPGMRAYHQHGIHQGRDEGRAKRVRSEENTSELQSL